MSTIKKYLAIFLINTIFFTVFNVNYCQAGILNNRINQYPRWHGQVNLSSPNQELIYPDWFAGNWQVTNILKEQIAPLAPQFETPGFSQNADYIDKEITFPVKFITTIINDNSDEFLPNNIVNKKVTIADREFNGRAIARAYLGVNNVKNVLINEKNSTEQITKFSDNNELISTVIGRQQETLNDHEFLTSEMTRQFFRRPGNIYINFVETTTRYQQLDPRHINAIQYTAVYLSPQDPSYFLAFKKPVALYAYELRLEKIND